MSAKPNTTEGLLRSLVERIENVEAQVADLNADKSDIYKEAKSHGFDVKVVKRVVAWRRKDANAAVEEETLFDIYRRALGMIPDEAGTLDATRARTISEPPREYIRGDRPDAAERKLAGGKAPDRVASSTENGESAIPDRTAISPAVATTPPARVADESPATIPAQRKPPYPGEHVGIGMPTDPSFAYLVDEHGRLLEDIPASLRRGAA